MMPPLLSRLSALAQVCIAATLGASLVAGCKDGGGADADGGTKVDSGGSMDGGMPGPAPIPDPQYLSCSALMLEFSGVECANPCPSVACECDGVGYFACDAEKGCLTSLACEVACQRRNDDVIACFSRDVSPCQSDADCAEGRCVGEAPGVLGDCLSGTTGSDCVNGSDCLEGFCVSESGGSARVCSAGAVGNRCNEDAHCQGDTRCARLPNSHAGYCTDGSQGARCSGLEQCAEGVCAGLNDGDLGTCSSGELGEACDQNADCLTGYCYGSCHDGQKGRSCRSDDQCVDRCIHDECSDGSRTATCEVDADCRAEDGLLCAGNRCYAGEIDDVCYQDSHCQSGLCAIRPDRPEGSGRCTAGQLGQHCGDNDQCVDAICARKVANDWRCMPPQEVGASCDVAEDEDCAEGRCARISRSATQSWQCQSGELGAGCAKDEHCNDGTCALRLRQDGTLPAPDDEDRIGMCTSGAEEDVCAGGSDCISGYCAIFPSNTLWGTCTSGALGAPCFGDAQCATGSCTYSGGALNTTPGMCVN